MAQPEEKLNTSHFHLRYQSQLNFQKVLLVLSAVEYSGPSWFGEQTDFVLLKGLKSILLLQSQFRKGIEYVLHEPGALFIGDG